MSEPQTIETVPPLVDGERLDRAEFHRRYEAMPQIKKAELIEGVVYMPSPVSFQQHATPHTLVMTWLGTYWEATPGVQPGDNATVQLDDENEPQPDAVLIILPEYGGNVTIGPRYLSDSPEFAADVSFSRVSVDLNQRYRAYERNGVREYLVWRLDTDTVLWFILRDGVCQRLQPDAAGILKSEVFPGLWLDPIAMTRMDDETITRVLNQGLASPEHQAFVELLAQRRGGQP